MQLAPRDKFKLSSFELLYVDPGLKKGKLNSLEMEQLMYAPQVGETMKVLTDYGTRWCLHPLTWPSIASGQETGCIWKPREQQFARSVQSQGEWTPLGDPKQEVEIFCLEVSGVTPWGHHMAVKWPRSLSLWRKNLEQETLLVPHVTLSLTLSFFSEKLPSVTRDTQATTVSLHLRAHFCL